MALEVNMETGILPPELKSIGQLFSGTPGTPLKVATPV
jgi:hypothetical protein